MRGLIEYPGQGSEGFRFWFWTALVALVNSAVLFSYTAAVILAWRVFA